MTPKLLLAASLLALTFAAQAGPLHLFTENTPPDIMRDGQRIVGEKLSQVEIASRVGASRDMVSRVFKELQEDGSIRLDRKQITLVRRG